MAHLGRWRRTIFHDVTTSYVIGFAFFCLSVDCYPKTSNIQKTWKGVNHEFEETSWQDETLSIFHFTSNYLPEATQMYDKVSSISHTTPLNADDLIPDFYKVILVVKPDATLSEEQVIKILCGAVSRVLAVPLENIKVSKFELSTGVLKLYFVNALNEKSNNLVLLPAPEVVPNMSIQKLQNETNLIKILSIKSGEKAVSSSTTKEVNVWSILNDQNWKGWQLAVIIACCLFALFCIVVVVAFLSTRRLAKDIPDVVEERQVVVQPILKPDVSGVNVIQPENKDCYIAETDSEHTPSPCRSPLRMKGKGLLERRGSNASLTLDLNRSQENVHYGTPPKECSTEEFLLSAGHRLTRKQLRNALKDVKSLHAEFWEIPMNHPEKVEVAGSGTKNRYKTILPNEPTRVHLNNADGDPLSGYINANYIKGYAGERNAYIATQGPMAHTVNDFWAMVWEQNCPIIVMITKLKEKLKVKCEPYIPDYQCHYMGIDVTVLKVIPRDGYTIRELLLSNGKESRCVYHFWYTAWPDHKTPDTAKQLLAMAVEVESLRRNSNGTIKGPSLVHCSAGIGRTGCFIAVSIGIQQLSEENVVDVLGIVCGLRLDRGGMVQTAEQYEFVHQALSVFELSMPDQSGE